MANQTKLPYRDREICANCKGWHEHYRGHFDAGTMAECTTLSSPIPRPHPSCEQVKVFTDYRMGDQGEVMVPIMTRYDFGCNQFERKEK